MENPRKLTGVVALLVGVGLMILSYVVALTSLSLVETMRYFLLLGVPTALAGIYLLVEERASPQVAFCPSCGYDNAAESIRCGRCGRDLPLEASGT